MNTKIVFLFLLGGMLACAKSPEVTNFNEPELTFDQFYNFLNAPANGSLSITKYDYGVGNTTDFCDLNAVFYDVDTDSKEGTTRSVSAMANDRNIIVEIGGYSVNSTYRSTKAKTQSNLEPPRISAASLYGTNVFFKMSQQNSSNALLKNSSPVMEDTLYIPEFLVLTSPELRHIVGGEESDTIYSDMEIKWNPDPKNKKGVVIQLFYEPLTTGNETFLSQGYNQSITNLDLVADLGHYKLPASMLKRIPKGAIVQVEVARGNFKLSSDQTLSETYALYGYTSVNILGIYR